MEDAVTYAATRDPALKADIVADHQWLVRKCAQKLQRRWESFDDLTQVCNVGLLEALERFDPGHGVRFSTYAEATMRGVLRHHYRSTWRVQFPRRLQELHQTCARLTETLTVDLRRTPTLVELADAANVTVAAVVEAQTVGQWPMALTHDDDTDDGLVAAVTDVDVDRRLDTMALLDRLNELSRLVLYLRYFEELTQTEVAAIVGLKQVAVSRVERSAVERLRALAS